MHLASGEALGNGDYLLVEIAQRGDALDGLRVTQFVDARFVDLALQRFLEGLLVGCWRCGFVQG